MFDINAIYIYITRYSILIKVVITRQFVMVVMGKLPAFKAILSLVLLPTDKKTLTLSTCLNI